VISRPHNATGPPLALLVLILLLALGSVGVGYGLWSRTLTVEGTVRTGAVDARWKLRPCFEFYPWPDGTNAGEVEGKNVGSTKLDYLRDEAGNVLDDQVLVLTIENGYPSYAVECQIHFVVEGTIPVYVRGIRLSPGPQLTGCEPVVFLPGDESPYTLECDQLSVVWFDGLGDQLHPGWEVASSLAMHVEQPAAQDSRYRLELALCLGQWNEGATAEECFAASP